MMRSLRNHQEQACIIYDRNDIIGNCPFGKRRYKLRFRFVPVDWCFLNILNIQSNSFRNQQFPARIVLYNLKKNFQKMI